MAVKVCKFGGTSMADASAITQSAKIVAADSERRYIVVSAPGKRFSGDNKVTDLLYTCYAESTSLGDCGRTFKKVRERFVEITKDLNLKMDIEKYLDEVEEGINRSITPDYAASRGEYLMARVFAAVVGADFIDTEKTIKFDESGDFAADYTNDLLSEELKKHERGVLPGFYGSLPNGRIKTFSRGGSDVTGALVARAASASVYENWTDVNGFLTADPKIVDNPEKIAYLSYKELRELSYMGANVLHPESIFPVRLAGIPINIKNTFEPSNPGTMIVPEKNRPQDDRIVTGIAGRKGFTIILIEKSMMNSERGFGRKILSVLEHRGISFEHLPSGIDTLSVVIADEEISGKLESVISDIRASVAPDTIEIHSGLSLIATVGHNMASRPGTAARLFQGLADANINIKMIDQGSSELNIIVGVDTADHENAINAIYHAFY
ncbi:MAG: aspartate kinase [Christensenellales bacterium]|jgi:aspartate kinase